MSYDDTVDYESIKDRPDFDNYRSVAYTGAEAGVKFPRDACTITLKDCDDYEIKYNLPNATICADNIGANKIVCKKIIAKGCEIDNLVADEIELDNCEIQVAKCRSASLTKSRVKNIYASCVNSDNDSSYYKGFAK